MMHMYIVLMAISEPVTYSTGYIAANTKILIHLKYELIVNIQAEGCDLSCWYACKTHPPNSTSQKTLKFGDS
jgi:hypothetical protein